MEKEDRIPLPRRRPAGSDGTAPTALATSAGAASDDGPAVGDAKPGQDEAGLGAGHGGLGSEDAGPGQGGAEDGPGSGSVLPRRVRGMSDGPRPPARVARPVMSASFLERVRAAAEAEQRLEQRAAEPAGPPAEPPSARPGSARRPPRFVRSRDWKSRNPDKKDRGGGHQPGPVPQARTAGEPSGQAVAPGDLWAARSDAVPVQDRTPPPDALGQAGAGGRAAGAEEPGSPSELPRRKAGASHRRSPERGRPGSGATSGSGTSGSGTSGSGTSGSGTSGSGTSGSGTSGGGEPGARRRGFDRAHPRDPGVPGG